ncbi:MULTISPECIES: trypsin-like peptidase domain-containing protein [Winogradskyella]|uniref:trypsin-like peptidase domain-containing protein n=1 Tax=Winogradskyella TaxID=286104 RepID=UPI0015CAABCA|nr:MULTISPECIES: trypsin-like peptidase domain-containing protein [Winogradskyella]QXP78715.1 trypsin-like peptidase domain-containing protein [Winogradskyella sp. HaHa_3_26]
MTINENSLKCVRIEVLAENTKAHLTWGSGFLCKKDEKTFLVTNWHIVTLKNFQTKENLHSSGAIPCFLNLFVHSIKQTESTSSWYELAIKELEIYNSEGEGDEKIFNNIPKWYEHPTSGSEIDVVVLDITSELANTSFELTSFNIDEEISKDVKLRVMDDVFVTGFPLKTSTTPNKLPIYKGATIASEPNMFSSLPLFYIDGKTKSGMSGSPVIKKDNDIKQIPSATAITLSQGRIGLVGVYSGRDRQEKDEYEAELGIVWKFKECLLPIIEYACS